MRNCLKAIDFSLMEYSKMRLISNSETCVNEKVSASATEAHNKVLKIFRYFCASLHSTVWPVLLLLLFSVHFQIERLNSFYVFVE